MFCFLNSAPSLCEGLIQLNGISRTQQLKLGLPKKLLNQRLEAKKEYQLPLDILNYGLISPEYDGVSIKLIQETNEIIAFQKPEKIHSHPLRYSESDNLLSGIYKLGRNELLQVNSTNYDRGLLYRLDYETSGLILYAKTDEVYSRIRKSFHDIAKSKLYQAVVEGELEKEMTLTHNLAASGERGSKMKESSEGKLAQLTVRPIRVVNGYTEVVVELKQGIRHQIRAQLSLAGFPIKGDELYGAAPADRTYLHCFTYDLGGWGKFTAESLF